MPTLSNSKHERFAQFLAQGKSIVDAHEQAGYKRNHGNAAALAKSPEINTRVREINAGALDRQQKATEMAIERAAVTIEGLLADAERIQRGAEGAGQWAAATAALKERGVLSGKRIERSERGAPGEFDFLEKLNPAQLEAYARGELDDLPAAEGESLH